jgi:long-chain acyl-CoA synthetase
MIKSPLENFLHWEKATPHHPFLRQPIHDVWHVYTYQKAGEEIRAIAQALIAMNFPPKSKIAILSKNCAHWIMADLAIWFAGHISVPIYPTLSARSVHYILRHSEAKAIFIGKLDEYNLQQHAIDDDVVKISFPFYGPTDGLAWNDLLAQKHALKINIPPMEHTASIMYSSGTTGTPKGVLISFYAFAYVGHMICKYNRILQPEQYFSYLPLSHIAERSYIEMTVLHSGSTISFSESLEKFAKNLAEVQPTVFGGVPRIYAKFQEAVFKKLPPKRLELLLKLPFIRDFVKKKIKKSLGFSRLKNIVVGAAPLPVSILRWYHQLDIPIEEMYGMTENTGYSHGDHGSTIHIGTVGRAWPDVLCKLAENGEILIKHEGLMQGYYKQEKETEEVFTADGFLKTGDLGHIDEKGYLTIIGRTKDQFKTDKAKYISPAPIENSMLINSALDHCCIVGEGLPQPIGIVTLSELGKSMSKERLTESIDATRKNVNDLLEHYEKVIKIIVLPTSWTIANGLLTPSLKVKRNEIEKIYKIYYSQWYQQTDTIIFE